MLHAAGSGQMEHRSVQRALLASAPAASAVQVPGLAAGCDSASWQCSVNSSVASVAPAIYSLVQSSQGNCSILSSGSALCGSYLLDLGLYNAIRGGSCKYGCDVQSPPGCAAITPAPAQLPYLAFRVPI